MKEAFERDLISEALRSTRGNAAAAARILNLSQRILNYKIKNYSINTAWFKNQK
ncbi:transcriptional regulator NifA subfamily Fis Family [Coraliomargarita sp. CAG:312]|nr:transcriptional regulator NifA subfamily Fis Family [Coraliomargarita sp. CAG:312]